MSVFKTSFILNAFLAFCFHMSKTELFLLRILKLNVFEWWTFMYNFTYFFHRQPQLSSYNK